MVMAGSKTNGTELLCSEQHQGKRDTRDGAGKKPTNSRIAQAK